MGLLFATISDESRVIKLRSRDRRHAGNKIDTAKYNLITFLPKSLLLQFTRLSNVVFLANAVLQAIPIISTITPITAISPLAFVLGISMLREGYEDYVPPSDIKKRHKKDWEINSRKSVVLRNREFIEVDWDEIHVGDFVKIKDGEVIPADILLLFSSSETGICYVETSNLDGENNLKEKHVVTDVPLNLSDELESLKGELTV
jgi:magnesium-transporting ATPase (P-type)